MPKIKFRKTEVASLVYFLSKILFRMTIFSLFLFLSLGLLYTAGNYQQFLDSSQELLLRAQIFISITLFFFAFISIVISALDCVLSHFFNYKKTLAFIFYFACLVLSAAVMLLSRALLVLSSGI